jgi:hypothetical protein
MGIAEMNKARRASYRWIWNVLAIAIVFAYIMLILFGKVGTAARLGWPEFVLIIFVLLFVEGVFSRIAALSVGKEGLTVQLNNLQANQEVQRSDLAAIRTALTGLVTKYEFQHLIHLNAPRPYFCKFGYIFFDEIRRLDSIQFIRPTTAGGFNAIKSEHELNRGEFDLKQYMKITDEGKSYLRARQTVSSA